LFLFSLNFLLLHPFSQVDDSGTISFLLSVLVPDTDQMITLPVVIYPTDISMFDYAAYSAAAAAASASSESLDGSATASMAGVTAVDGQTYYYVDENGQPVMYDPSQMDPYYLAQLQQQQQQQQEELLAQMEPEQYQLYLQQQQQQYEYSQQMYAAQQQQQQQQQGEQQGQQAAVYESDGHGEAVAVHAPLYPSLSALTASYPQPLQSASRLP
jgi:hypothetical protein